MARDPRSVLHVVGNGGAGGMQAQVALVSGLLARERWRVTVAVGGGGEFPAVPGVEVVPLPSLDPRRPVAFTRALRRTARERDCAIVHAHGLRLAPLLRWTGVAARFVTCHGLDPLRAAATVRAVRRSPVCFLSCGEGPRAVLAAHGLRSRVVDNLLGALAPPVDRASLNAEFALDADVPLVVLPARFSEQKNHQQLLAALGGVRRALGARAPEVLCFGDGPLRATIQASAERPGDRPLVRCLPHRAGASGLLAAADFFVLTSRWEGQPTVVLEALAQGLAVAATTPTGLEDLILDGQNGRVLNSTEELAATVTAWCTEPHSRPSNTRLTSEILQRHAPEVVLRAYDTLYLDSAADRRP